MPKISYSTDTTTEVYEVSIDEILFNAAEAKGLELPHGCLSGSCGACIIEVTHGEQNLGQVGAVELDTIDHISQEYKNKHGENSLDGKKLRLACRTKVKGDLSFKTLKR